MEPSNEFDELFEEMKDVKRSEKAKHNTWIALKDRMAKKRKRPIFPAFISLAIIAIASLLFLTFANPLESEKSAKPLSNEEAIMAVLEKEYNGPDKELIRLKNDWFNLQSNTDTKNQEEYDQLLQSKEYKDYIDYYFTTFGEYFTEDELKHVISSVLVFKYNHYLEDTDLEIHLENVDIKQEKDYPNIYRPIIEVSLTNRQGQKIHHTIQEEFIFSTSEPGKIGRYNVIKEGGDIGLREKIASFKAYVGDLRTPSIDVSFDTLCFNGRILAQQDKVEFKTGCTSNKKQINSIMNKINLLPIKETTDQETNERTELLPQIENYQIYLTNDADQETTLYTITLYEDGILVFAPDSNLGIAGDITLEPHVFLYEEIKLMLDEFANN